MWILFLANKTSYVFCPVDLVFSDLHRMGLHLIVFAWNEKFYAKFEFIDIHDVNEQNGKRDGFVLEYKIDGQGHIVIYFRMRSTKKYFAVANYAVGNENLCVNYVMRSEIPFIQLKFKQIMNLGIRFKNLSTK